MSSGFVSGGTIDNPTERDDEWRRAQQELEDKRREREDQGKQNDGKSLFEVLQANKAAKQEAFEEATRLKNQFRALNDDEAEYLDSVLEATRKQEAAVNKETIEQLDAFRRQQEEAERKALEEQNVDGPTESEVQWATSGHKRKKAHESSLLKGVKRTKLSAAEEAGAAGKKIENAKKGDDPSSKFVERPVANPPVKTTAPAKPSNPVSLGLGYASSDDDD